MGKAPDPTPSSPRDIAIARLRSLRLAAARRGPVGRASARLVEVAEAIVAHGLVETGRRIRLRVAPSRLAAPRGYEPPPTNLQAVPPIAIPPADGPPHASIVIPVLDNAALTYACLRAIAQHSPRGRYEVIVVDNGSGDETRSMLEGIAGLRLIRNERNLGFVEACNQGAATALGAVLVFLNNDTAPLPGWLTALLDTIEQNPTVGAVGAKLLYPNGELQEAGSIIGRDGSGWNYGRGLNPQAPEFNYVRDVDYCSGACLAVRRDLFAAAGGFDRRFAPAYYEDVDLCFRLRALGHRVWYQPAAEVVHVEGGTAGRDTSSGFKRHQVTNRVTFVERHRDALEGQTDLASHAPHLARERDARLRVLVVDHMVPEPDRDSGSLRMAAILGILRDLRCAVTFVPDNVVRSEPYTRHLQQLGIEVLYAPLSVAGYLRRRAADYDIVVLSRAHVAAKYHGVVRRAAPRSRLVFDTVDLQHLRETREAGNNPALARAAERTRAVEYALMAGSDMVWVSSTYEADLIRNQDPGIQIEIVPNVHQVRRQVPSFSLRRDLLFVGGFRHRPNADAVVSFVRDIFPRVRQQLPGVRLLVAGPDAPEHVQALAGADVTILGHVENLEALLDACRVSVAPVRVGAGVKGKISHSLASGVPVVTTPVGAEGMELTDGEHILVAATDEDFARLVVQLYEDEPLWDRLSAGGRQRIEEHYGSEAVRARIDESLRRVTQSSDAQP